MRRTEPGSRPGVRPRAAAPLLPRIGSCGHGGGPTGARHLGDRVGGAGISVESVNLQNVLREALSLVRPLAREEAVRLEDDSTGLAGWFVLADQQRLKQVLINLLANAIKYNRPGGKVTVSCDRAVPDRVGIVVSDTGIGMNAEQLESLFVPF